MANIARCFSRVDERLTRHDKAFELLLKQKQVSMEEAREYRCTGTGELQDLEFGGKKLWQIIAEKISHGWNRHNNCMLVVGATYPEEIKKIRSVAGDMTFLVPGIGLQGGDLEAVMKVGLNSAGLGLIINSSRGIIFTENPGEEARKLCAQIQVCHFFKVDNIS